MLAEAMDVSARYISDIENGITWPRADKVEKLRQIFDVKYRDLFDF
jgi:transcriptional regulator with XRE-family HTH domain